MLYIILSVRTTASQGSIPGLWSQGWRERLVWWVLNMILSELITFQAVLIISLWCWFVQQASKQIQGLVLEDEKTKDLTDTVC